MRLPVLPVALGLIGCLTACAGTSPAPAPIAAIEPAAVAAPVIAAAAPQKPADESLTIDFDRNDASLSPAAAAQLDGAARLYRDAHPEVMIVSGHSDKSGREFENLILSARRADLVKQALVQRGIPAERLQIVAVGEAEPVAGIPASRSAVVTWR